MKVIDIFFILSFVGFTFFAIGTDSLVYVAYYQTGTWTAPLNAATLQNAPFPPEPLRSGIIWWNKEVDHLYQSNPLWMCLLGVYPTPFYIIFYLSAIYALIREREWIRTAGYVWGVLMASNVTIIIAEGLYGPHATPNRQLYLAAYGPYLAVPVLWLLRLLFVPLSSRTPKVNNKQKSN